MIDGSYSVEIDGETRNIDMVQAGKPNGTPQFVEPPKKRSTALLWLDCFVVFLIFVLPATYLYSTEMFIVNIAAVSGIVLTAYFKIVCLILTALGPSDTPHIIAIIKAPERLYCPRCGVPKTQKYCSGCGVNVEKQYRKLVRQLAYYAVQDTNEQREFLESSLRGYLQQVTERQQKEIVAALEKMERNYVMEIVRQRKEIRQLQQRRLEARAALGED